MTARPFLRLTRLSWTQRLMLVEAIVALAGASLAIHLLSFKRVAAAAGRRQEASGAASLAEAKQMRWAVETWAQRVPWRAVCFQRGLALHLMLRRKGMPSLLHYGVAQAEDGLTAHVWVSLDEVILIGGAEAPRFACLATFPAGNG